MVDAKHRILDELRPLFEQAERDGLVFHCHYQDMWFTPKELRKAHSEGRFVWGPELRDPKERADTLRRQGRNTLSDAEAWERRVREQHQPDPQ